MEHEPEPEPQPEHEPEPQPQPEPEPQPQPRPESPRQPLRPAPPPRDEWAGVATELALRHTFNVPRDNLLGGQWQVAAEEVPVKLLPGQFGEGGTSDPPLPSLPFPTRPIPRAAPSLFRFAHSAAAAHGRGRRRHVVGAGRQVLQVRPRGPRELDAGLVLPRGGEPGGGGAAGRGVQRAQAPQDCRLHPALRHRARAPRGTPAL